MSGLVGYDTSDEESKSQAAEPRAPTVINRPEISETRDHVKRDDDVYIDGPDANHSAVTTQEPARNGTSSMDRYRLEGPMINAKDSSDGEDSSRLDQRTTLRDLTLPTVPNLDIPGSPPGSPSEMMTEKVRRFLQLKEQGIHFNEKLALSSSLKNPSMLGKLCTFAGLDGQDQYATSLPIDLWDPQGFPSWASKEELGRAQERAVKMREEQIAQGLRSGVEFVKAGNETLLSKGKPIIAQRQGELQQNGDQRADRSRDRAYRKRSRSSDRRR